MVPSKGTDTKITLKTNKKWGPKKNHKEQTQNGTKKENHN